MKEHSLRYNSFDDPLVSGCLQQLLISISVCVEKTSPFPPSQRGMYFSLLMSDKEIEGGEKEKSERENEDLMGNERLIRSPLLLPMLQLGVRGIG